MSKYLFMQGIMPFNFNLTSHYIRSNGSASWSAGATAQILRFRN
ncbi:hypothetical protein [Chitinophaga filiformis]|nr:hypothetical protein [Chitinophaga filiformis]